MLIDSRLDGARPANAPVSGDQRGDDAAIASFFLANHIAGRNTKITKVD